MAAEMKVTALLLVALAGCTNTTDPILVDAVCTKSEEITTLMTIPVSCGQNCMTVMVFPQVSVVCLRRVNFVYPNPNYKESSK